MCRSPIYALLGETLDGVLTVRAFEAEKSLSDRMVAMLNTQQTAYHLTFSAQSWLSIRLEFAGTLIITGACLLAVLEHPMMGGNEHFAGKSASFHLSKMKLRGKRVSLISSCLYRACRSFSVVCAIHNQYVKLDRQDGK